MNIAVDIGNTRLKCGFFAPSYREGNALKVWNLPLPSKEGELEPSFFRDLLVWEEEVITWRIAQTGSFSWQQLKKAILNIRPQDKFRTVTHKRIPYKFNVDSPEMVGIDRLLAAFAATMKYDTVPILIVDVGSAITIDIFSNWTFYGGAILPGLTAMLETYPKISEKLPLVPIPDSALETRPIYPGKNTKDAILNGLYWGTIGAIRQFYEALRKYNAPLVLTGGGANYLFPGLSQEMPEQQIKRHEHLVLEGINWCHFR